MTTERRPNDVESLLVHGDGIRRLARSLMRDPGLADDVVQETWLVALRQPPRAGWVPAAWLSGVARHVAMNSLRSATRRRRRESTVARHDEMPSAADVVARIETQALVLAAVRALEEPYRSAITLRYLDGRPPRDIAAMRGIPVATVRSHLLRGLAQLRGLLDAKHGGDRRTWGAALLPLALRRASDLPSIGMGIAVRIGAVAAAITLAVGGASVLALQALARPPAHDPSVAAPATPEGPAPVGASADGAALAAAPHRNAPASREGKEGPAWASGRVMDLAGHPLGGIPVEALAQPHEEDVSDPYSVESRLRPPPQDSIVATTVSGHDGTFLVEGLDEHRRYRLRAHPAAPDVGWAVTLRPIEGKNSDLQLWVRSGGAVTGRVVDSAGHGVAADVLIHVHESGARMRNSSVERWSPVQTLARSDGRFEAIMPNGQGTVVIYASAERVSYFCCDVPWTGEKTFAVGESNGATIEGTVFDEDGHGVGGARVKFEITAAPPSPAGSLCVSTQSDSEGHYSISELPPGSVRHVEASAEGWAETAPASLALPLSLGTATKFDVRIERGLSIRGRVRDELGAPIEGAVVRVEVISGNSPLHPYMRTGPDGHFSFTNLPGGGGEILAMAPGRYPVAPDRDAKGERIGLIEVAGTKGLIERDIVLRRGIPAAGRVLDVSGVGVPGALVVATSGTLNLGYVEGYLPYAVTTSEEGKFRFEGLPPAGDWRFEARRQGSFAQTAVSIRLEAGGAAPEIVLRLAPLGVLSGHVLGPDEKPSVGVAVVLTGGIGQESRSATSDADGAFAFHELRPGTYEVRPSSAGTSAHASVERTVAAGGRVEDVVLHIVATSSTDGVIVGSDGSPLANRQVRLSAVSGRAPSQALTTSDAKGAFRIDGLEPGTYRVEVDGIPSEDTLAAGTSGIKIRSGAALSRWIEGIVLAPDGSPCPLATVMLLTTTDSVGMGSPTEVAGGHFGSTAAQSQVVERTHRSPWGTHVRQTDPLSAHSPSSSIRSRPTR